MELVALDRVPDEDEIGVGSVVLFPQVRARVRFERWGGSGEWNWREGGGLGLGARVCARGCMQTCLHVLACSCGSRVTTGPVPWERPDQWRRSLASRAHHKHPHRKPINHRGLTHETKGGSERRQQRAALEGCVCVCVCVWLPSLCLFLTLISVAAAAASQENGVRVYDGEHVKGEADNKWVTFRGSLLRDFHPSLR